MFRQFTFSQFFYVDNKIIRLVYAEKTNLCDEQKNPKLDKVLKINIGKKLGWKK